MADAAQPTLESLKTSQPNEWRVDKNTCIGCRACSDSYPEGFGFDDAENLAFEIAATPPGKYDPDEVIQICPSDSIFIPGYEGNPSAQGGKWAGNTGDEVSAGDGEDHDSPYEAVLRPSENHRAEELELPEPIFQGVGQKLAVAITMPIVGALPPRIRRRIDERVQDELFFSSRQAAALNIVLNLFLYTAILVVAALVGGASIYGASLKGAILLGFGLGTIEGAYRMLGGPFWYRGHERDEVLGAWYTMPIGVLSTVRGAWSRRRIGVGPSPFAKHWHDGGAVGASRPMVNLDLERDRARRYGNVYEIEATKTGAEVSFEFPRWFREDPSSELQALPHYEWRLDQDANTLTVSASIPEGRVTGSIGSVNSLPPSFEKMLLFERDIASVASSYDEDSRILRISVSLAGEHATVFDDIEGVGSAVHRAA
ncbi:MAG: hypothetical protein CME06_15535 [Gemmatimonadetes bacterium]|nr:hypothetical protein [Gemmatimonadota bacterium]